MKLIRLLLAERRWAFAGVVFLSLLSALLSVGVIAFVNQHMLQSADDVSGLLLQFAALLGLLLITATGARTALHMLGHQFVYRLRCKLVKQVLDTDIERLEVLNGSRIIAALSTDIRNVTIAFVHLPEMVYGLALSLAALAYLAALSLPLFTMTALWLGILLLAGGYLIGRINHYIRCVRENDDYLYGDYQSIIEGRKELALNRYRAQRLYEEEFERNAQAYRDHVTRADIYNGLAGNVANTMVLGLIGIIFYLALGLGWAEMSVATTYGLTILFLRTPLIGALAGMPALIAANVSLNKLESLALTPYRASFESISPAFSGCRRISLQGISYHYEHTGEQGFSVGPLDLTLERGELVFLIGGNGSGKSTLARLLTGLYRPQAGKLYVDGAEVSADDWQAYRHLFSSVFTDFHLFQRLLTGEGQDVPIEQVDHWLQRLGMQHKVRHSNGRLSDTRFSQGQRKRLALLMMMLEQRDFLVLDEWAADQDPQFRRFFYRQLLPELRIAGKSIVAITHDDHYFDGADRILKMDGGQLIELDGDERARVSVDAVRAISTA
ncbi:multidrug ABC transporter permease/ATP-binding protein [Nitrosococcus wardiae]|uniref:Multidrug ABC transporter permease/ATP-binding protein n=1 Tax=Nitrosococcus wardiae TaxID=1814290 RepID=A0A4P7C194_9GAMM|nr:multidrug ABC transporter permease/ATP-binding protein [Nitrosococcus wardiae]QBQ55214.1 multidrug ABC transporter permease/ATP-binding protein [Nitrosococcus wardiae]